MSDTLLMWGLIAGGLQLLGYILYLLYLWKEKSKPNPLTWLMFSYGTVILTILELDKNATLDILILPLVCSALGVLVFLFVWFLAIKEIYIETGKFRIWPKGLHPQNAYEKVSFGSDILITIGYVTSSILAASSLLEPASRETALVVFLVLSNFSVLIEFFPITLSTYKNPKEENVAPWAIWAVAYAILGVVTWHSEKQDFLFMMYPVLNCFTHAVIAVLARDSRRKGDA